MIAYIKITKVLVDLIPILDGPVILEAKFVGANRLTRPPTFERVIYIPIFDLHPDVWDDWVPESSGWSAALYPIAAALAQLPAGLRRALALLRLL